MSSAMRKVAMRGLAAHKVRFSLTVLSVVLGTAFIAASFIFTQMLGKSFDDIVELSSDGVATAGAADRGAECGRAARPRRHGGCGGRRPRRRAEHGRTAHPCRRGRQGRRQRRCPVGRLRLGRRGRRRSATPARSPTAARREAKTRSSSTRPLPRRPAWRSATTPRSSCSTAGRRTSRSWGSTTPTSPGWAASSGRLHARTRPRPSSRTVSTPRTSWWPRTRAWTRAS